MTETTPRGREVHPLVGSADAIAAEGTRLLRTGDLMDETARWFEAIYRSTAVGKGFSIDALRGDAENVGGGLEMIATRCRDSGKAVNLYAEAFGELQPLFEPIPGELAELRDAEGQADAELQSVRGVIGANRFRNTWDDWRSNFHTGPTLPFSVTSLDGVERVVLPADAEVGDVMPAVLEIEQLLEEYVQWVDAEIARLHGLYDGHYDAWEAAAAAYAHGLVVAADPVDVGWGGGGVTDTWGENWYQMFDTLANEAGKVGVVADLATAGGAAASMTGWGAVVGVPLAAEAVVVSTAAGCVEWIASAGKTVLSAGGHVRRVDGQVSNDWFGLGKSTVGLLPFDGLFKAKGWADVSADGAAGMLTAIFSVGGGAIDLGTSTDPIDTWRTSMAEEPYVPPTRVPGQPVTTTVAQMPPYRSW